MITPTASVGVGGLSTKVLLVIRDSLHLGDIFDGCRKYHNVVLRNPRPKCLLHVMKLRPHPQDFSIIHARTKTSQVLDNVGVMRPRLHDEEAEKPDDRTHTCRVATNTNIEHLLDVLVHEQITRLQSFQDISHLLRGKVLIPTTPDFADDLVEVEWRDLLGHILASGRAVGLSANLKWPAVLLMPQASHEVHNAICLHQIFLSGVAAENPEAGELLVSGVNILASGRDTVRPKNRRQAMKIIVHLTCIPAPTQEEVLSLPETS